MIPFAILKPVLLVAAILAAIGLTTAILWNESEKHVEVRRPIDAEDANASTESAGIVELTAEKLKASAIESETVSRGSLIRTHSVPGRVQYNDSRHIDVRSPVAGIVTSVLVKPGDRVTSGQVLAWLNSPEVGTARADVLKHEAAAKLAEQLSERADAMHQNLLELTDALKQHESFDELRSRFSTMMLGGFRKRLVGGYARLLLADAMMSNASQLDQTGGLPGNMRLQRQNDQRSAEAELSGACEQAILDAWRARSEADAAAHDASRRLQVVRQTLASMLLTPGLISGSQSIGTDADLEESSSDLAQLSRFPIRAPFGGTIEERRLSPGERVQPSNAFFVLADTNSLWIHIEIREGDWPAITLREGTEVSVSVPAIPDRIWKTRIAFVGREVSRETNAVPIIAEIDNADGLLRPELFVHVEVPVGAKPNVLTVPEQAIMRHEGTAFVFEQETPGRYRRIDVDLGEAGASRVEVVKGLRDNQTIVTRGAFVLASELLLESEEE